MGGQERTVAARRAGAKTIIFPVGDSSTWILSLVALDQDTPCSKCFPSRSMRNRKMTLVRYFRVRLSGAHLEGGRLGWCTSKHRTAAFKIPSAKDLYAHSRN